MVNDVGYMICVLIGWGILLGYIIYKFRGSASTAKRVEE